MAVCLAGGAAWTGDVMPGVGTVACAAATNAAAVSDNSLQGIAGTWREEGVPGARVLTIYADGTYDLLYEDGKAFGTVRVTSEEHPDGSKSLWYSFYEEGGLSLEDKDTASPWYSAYNSANKLWAAFPRDGAATQTELRSGQDGAMRFVRNRNDGYHETGAGVKATDYVGVWGCGRCTAVISREGAGYLVEIQWASNAAEGSRWTYHCTYDNDAAILFSNSRSNGTRTDYAYTEENSVTNKEIYNDGSAVFILRNGTLTWQDKKENAGEDMEFIR